MFRIDWILLVIFLVSSSLSPKKSLSVKRIGCTEMFKIFLNVYQYFAPVYKILLTSIQAFGFFRYPLVNIARSSNNNLMRGPLLRLATASWTEYKIGELKVRHKQRRQKSDPNQLSRRPDCHGSLDCRNQYLWQGFEACGHLIYRRLIAAVKAVRSPTTFVFRDQT